MDKELKNKISKLELENKSLKEENLFLKKSIEDYELFCTKLHKAKLFMFLKSCKRKIKKLIKRG